MNRQDVYLYVEKYTVQEEGELIVDFLREEDLFRFASALDLRINTEESFQSSLLSFVNFNTKVTLYENGMIIMEWDRFINACKSSRVSDASRNDQSIQRCGILMELNGSFFSEALSNFDTHIEKRVSSDFIYTAEEKGEFDLQYNTFNKMCVWDVGQGSTNCLHGENSIMLFDMGVSTHMTNKEACDILDRHKCILHKDKERILIISHWDTDHYNLLPIVSKNFLLSISIVFVPQFIVGQAAISACKRLLKYCKCVKPIASRPKINPNRCGINAVINSSTFELYCGEVSSDKNRSGLLAVVSGSKDSVFLTADHTNYQVWNLMYKNTLILQGKLNVVVPHHCGDCGKTKIKNGNGIAAISVGTNNYGHPVWSVRQDYQNAGYSIKETEAVIGTGLYRTTQYKNGDISLNF